MTTKKDLDGIYFRVKRGKHWESICFMTCQTKKWTRCLKGIA